MSYNDHIRIFDWTEISLKTLQLKHSDIQKNQTKKSTYWWCSGDKLCQQNKQMHILHNQKQPILLTATSTTIQSQQPVLVPVNPPVLNPGDGEPRALNSGCGAPPTPKAPIPVPQEPSAARVGASIRPELPRGDREARSAVSSGKLPSLGLSTLKIPPEARPLLVVVVEDRTGVGIRGSRDPPSSSWESRSGRVNKQRDPHNQTFG